MFSGRRLSSQGVFWHVIIIGCIQFVRLKDVDTPWHSTGTDMCLPQMETFTKGPRDTATKELWDRYGKSACTGVGGRIQQKQPKQLPWHTTRFDRLEAYYGQDDE